MSDRLEKLASNALALLVYCSVANAAFADSQPCVIEAQYFYEDRSEVNYENLESCLGFDGAEPSKSKCEDTVILYAEEKSSTMLRELYFCIAAEKPSGKDDAGKADEESPDSESAIEALGAKMRRNTEKYGAPTSGSISVIRALN